MAKNNEVKIKITINTGDQTKVIYKTTSNAAACARKERDRVGHGYVSFEIVEKHDRKKYKGGF